MLCRPVPVGALFAPTRGLDFQALHPLSFLFICTLHCCKHRARLEVAAILRKFPSTALCVDAGYGGIFRPVPVGEYFAPTTGLFFQALHLLTFLFICTLHWCKPCAGQMVAASLRKFSLTALCVAAGYGGALQARTGRCAFCTNKGFAFSGSPSP